MGMNYYYSEKGICSECGRPHEKIHIGHDTLGWAFALHIYPGFGPVRIDEWKLKFYKKGSAIFDEFGKAVNPDHLVILIQGERPKVDGHLYRRQIGDNFCVGHEDNIDLCIGDFS